MAGGGAFLGDRTADSCQAFDKRFPAGPRCGLRRFGRSRDPQTSTDGDAHVFDTRTRAEFTGEDMRNRTRGGHLPGARHLSHTDLLDNGAVRPAPVLRAMMERVGFGSGDHIVTHGKGGGRATLAAAAAIRAGYGDVRVYYLSFADWARDESCPIVRD